MFIKQRQILLLAGVFLLGAATVAPAQEPVKLSLQEAITMAHQNNTNILNSELDLKSARKRIWETIATGLPHVDASASYQHIFKVPTLSFPSSELSTTRQPYDPVTQTGTVGNGVGLSTGDSIFTNMVAGPALELGVKDNITYDFTLSQLIFSGSYLVGLQASKTYYGLSEQNAEKTKLDVTETVINTYNMIQLAEESKKILNQNLENIDQTLYEVTEMNKQGFVEKTDVDQLELSGMTIKNALNQIESNLDMGYRLLKIQIGMDEATPVQLSDPLASGESLTASSMQLINEPFSLERNVDYKLIRTSEKAASLELKLTKSAYLPTIAGFYVHTEKVNAPAFDFAPKDVVGVNLSLPIFSSGERMAQVSQKRFSLEKAQNTRKFVSSNLMMQATEYQNDVKLKLEKYQNQKKSMELSDVIYQRTLEKYKQGMATSMDLMNSQNQYLTNLTNYYQSIFDLESSKSKLEKLFNINQDTIK